MTPRRGAAYTSAIARSVCSLQLCNMRRDQHFVLPRAMIASAMIRDSQADSEVCGTMNHELNHEWEAGIAGLPVITS